MKKILVLLLLSFSITTAQITVNHLLNHLTGFTQTEVGIIDFGSSFKIYVDNNSTPDNSKQFTTRGETFNFFAYDITSTKSNYLRPNVWHKLKIVCSNGSTNIIFVKPTTMQDTKGDSPDFVVYASGGYFGKEFDKPDWDEVFSKSLPMTQSISDKTPSYNQNITFTLSKKGTWVFPSSLTYNWYVNNNLVAGQTSRNFTKKITEDENVKCKVKNTLENITYNFEWNVVLPVIVNITGPTELGYKKTGTFRAITTGDNCSSPAYRWWKRNYPNGIWHELTQTTQTVDINMSAVDFQLKVKATCGYYYAYDYHIVDYWSGNSVRLPKNNDELQIKARTQLLENYPNPFNPETNIVFSLSEPNFTNLIVYNSLGETVAILANEYKDAGSYDITFDGSNLPSGIYFYRIQSGNFIDIKKMILMK